MSRQCRVPAWVILFALVLGGTGRLAAQANGAGEVSVVLSYTVPAAHRAAFREYCTSVERPRLEGWKSKGVFAGYELLFPLLTNEAEPVTLILHFSHFADLGAWTAVEATQPGGLDAAGLALATPKAADLADLLHESRTAVPAGVKPVVMLIPYVVTAEPAKYRKYALEYVLPQMDGWMRNGVMSAYGLYLNENPAGSSWGALLVLQYNGLDGLAQREVLKAKVRSELASNPAWKAWSEDKSSIRTEGHPVIAEPLNPL